MVLVGLSRPFLARTPQPDKERQVFRTMLSTVAERVLHNGLGVMFVVSAPFSGIPSPPQQNLHEVLPLLVSQDVNQLSVLEHGRLIGVISCEGILRFLEIRRGLGICSSSARMLMGWSYFVTGGPSPCAVCLPCCSAWWPCSDRASPWRRW